MTKTRGPQGRHFFDPKLTNHLLLSLPGHRPWHFPPPSCACGLGPAMAWDRAEGRQGGGVWKGSFFLVDCVLKVFWCFFVDCGLEDLLTLIAKYLFSGFFF